MLYRENHARDLYLQVQDRNVALLLPFVLTYPPRACASLESTELEYDWKVKAYSSESMELTEGMAVRRGFNHSMNCLNFKRKWSEILSQLSPVFSRSRLMEDKSIRNLDKIYSRLTHLEYVVYIE